MSGGRDRPIVALSDDECHELLARQRLCVLSVVDRGGPYAVPVFYGFDGEALYLGITEGRKTRALDDDPHVYVVVTEVGPGDAWRSVAATGIARVVSDPAEYARAIEVLVAHNARVRGAGGDTRRQAAPPPRRGTGRVLRIALDDVTGRARA